MQIESEQRITEIKELKDASWMTIELNGANVEKLQEGKPVFGNTYGKPNRA